jgi:hypothetical protein
LRDFLKPLEHIASQLPDFCIELALHLGKGKRVVGFGSIDKCLDVCQVSFVLLADVAIR